MISQEAINELWRAGYTLTRRLDDPTNLSHKDIPNTRAYQWMHLVHDKVLIDSGWAPVPHSRHNGRFAPWGTEGNIEWQGLGLFEKPLFEVEAEQAVNHAKAHQNVDDWAKKNAANGITGGATVGIQTKLGELDSLTTHKVGEEVHIDANTKTIDTTVRIPGEMQQHVLAILEERDRLSQAHIEDSLEVAPISQKFHEHMKANPHDPMWPTLHALMMPKAIENVRARLASPKEA